MLKVVGFACMMMLTLLAGSAGQNQFSRFKAIDAYVVRPGVLMIPTLSTDGEICEIGLERLHYSPEMIRLESELSRTEIDEVFDEIVPASERGPQTKSFAGTLITQSGGNLIMTLDYEKVIIQIYSAASSTTGKKAVAAEQVVATLKWKNRKCR